jgi:hypothetical protein
MQTLLSVSPNLRQNFENSPWACCTFNFGPFTVSIPHLDFANLAWGWCAITALGNFDPDKGGHLILWDLGLVIRLPPGCTVLIPSAILRHSNVKIQPGETRYSFTQYTAGHLFRWVDNSGKTDVNLEEEAKTRDDLKAWKAAQATKSATRFEQGLKSFMTLTELYE